MKKQRTHVSRVAENVFAFTLVELLVVIGIIVVLFALIFPVAGSAIENANQAKCTSNMRWLMQRMFTCAAENNGLLPSGSAYDQTAYNYYSLNTDAPFPVSPLAEGDGNGRIHAHCPSDKGAKHSGKEMRTSYWFPLCLQLAPDLVNAGTPQPLTPQPVASVQYPAKKIMIIEWHPYHNRQMSWNDIANSHPNQTAQGVSATPKFNMGFFDGHMEFRDTKRYNASSNPFGMLDTDPNWTGRGTSEPGLRGKDFN